MSHNGRMCFVGDVGSSEDYICAEVIKEQFPERIDYSGKKIITIIEVFNDHTTYEDVISVMEKASVRMEEL